MMSLMKSCSLTIGFFLGFLLSTELSLFGNLRLELLLPPPDEVDCFAAVVRLEPTVLIFLFG